MLILFAGNVFAQTQSYFSTKNSLYISIYHSGSMAGEYYTIDRIKQIDHFVFPDTYYIENFAEENHRLLVYDSVSNQLLFSAPLSAPVFDNYLKTEEAQSACGNFEEFFVLPLPEKTIKMVFESKRPENPDTFTTIFATFLNPKTAYIAK